MTNDFRTGIQENAGRFIMLIIINFFVGSMVGLERTVLPLVCEKDFGLASASASLSFIISFGFSKALMNLVAGTLADRFGRKLLLIVGWGVGFLCTASCHTGNGVVDDRRRQRASRHKSGFDLVDDGKYENRYG